MRKIVVKTQRSPRSVIGVDLGGSRIRLAFVGPMGRRTGRVLTVPVTDRALTSVLALLIDSIRRLQGSGPRPSAVGIGIPGFIHRKKVCILRSPNFPGWRNVPIRDLLEPRLNLPVLIENDANAAAFGEAWIGSGRGARSLLYLGLGTGVGGGVVLDGRVWHGREGLAGEIGHITIDPKGPVCGCGNHGCLESYASATAVVRSYAEKAGRPVTGLTARDVALLARGRNQKASAVYRELGRALGIAIADLLNIFDPERIVIGGGVAQAWPLFHSAMMDEIGRRAIRPVRLGERIKRGKLKDEAGMIGAAGLAYHRLGVKDF
ncbi:MAG: ROK family protein [Nitrospirae bacterium]|nr:ROK family protein [Nitrospirota bacterium]